MLEQLNYDEMVAGALNFIKEKLKFKYSSQSRYRIAWSLIKGFIHGSRDVHSHVNLNERYLTLRATKTPKTGLYPLVIV